MIEKCKLNVRNVRFEPRSKMECTKSTPINLYYSVILLLYHSILIVSLCLFVETTLRFSAIVKTLKPDLRIFHRFASQKYHRQKRWYAIFKLSKYIYIRILQESILEYRTVAAFQVQPCVTEELARLLTQQSLQQITIKYSTTIYTTTRYKHGTHSMVVCMDTFFCFCFYCVLCVLYAIV